MITSSRARVLQVSLRSWEAALGVSSARDVVGFQGSDTAGDLSSAESESVVAPDASILTNCETGSLEDLCPLEILLLCASHFSCLCLSLLLVDGDFFFLFFKPVALVSETPGLTHGFFTVHLLQSWFLFVHTID